MHYQLVQLAQLALSLLFMFAAFLGGLALGWWRWGRVAKGSQTDQPPPVGPVGLFTPEERDDEIVLADLTEDYSMDPAAPVAFSSESAPLFAAAGIPPDAGAPALPSPPAGVEPNGSGVQMSGSQE